MRLRSVYMAFLSISLFVLIVSSYGARLHSDSPNNDIGFTLGSTYHQVDGRLFDLRESSNRLYVDSKKDQILFALREPQIPREPRIPSEPQIPREPKAFCMPESKNIG